MGVVIVAVATVAALLRNRVVVTSVDTDRYTYEVYHRTAPAPDIRQVVEVAVQDRCVVVRDATITGSPWHVAAIPSPKIAGVDGIDLADAVDRPTGTLFLTGAPRLATDRSSETWWERLLIGDHCLDAFSGYWAMNELQPLGVLSEEDLREGSYVLAGARATVREAALGAGPELQRNPAATSSTFPSPPSTASELSDYFDAYAGQSSPLAVDRLRAVIALREEWELSPAAERAALLYVLEYVEIHLSGDPQITKRVTW